MSALREYEDFHQQSKRLRGDYERFVGFLSGTSESGDDAYSQPYLRVPLPPIDL
ncbi:hypothetical protein R3P38DRAFT_3195994 [Favolaschia claudopus]|uniref:Uncharacterized protein n=1 Tax=Favolaschia claudopus TaxID=2862362 RepID=A0AAW0B8Y4_9AGAR